MAKQVGGARPRSRQSIFQLRGFVVGVVLALGLGLLYPWLRSGAVTITIISIALVGAIGSLIGGLLYGILAANADPSAFGADRPERAAGTPEDS